MPESTWKLTSSTTAMRIQCRGLLLGVIVFWAQVVSGQTVINGFNWFPIGPTGVTRGQSWPYDNHVTISGRATSISANRNNPNDVWLGTAGGGVWHSTNGGVNWVPMSDFTPSLAIGSVVLDERAGGPCPLVYVGTGENSIRRDTYYGRGLLVYKPQGEVMTCGWVVLGEDKFNLASINNVVLDRSTSGGNQRLYVTLSSGVTASATESTITAPPPPDGYGIYQSENQGATWTRLTVPGAEGFKPTDLEMAPNNSNVLYAGFMGRGAFRGVRDPSMGNINWCPLNPGIPLPAGCSAASGLPDPATGFDHVEISIHPTANPLVMYAILGNCPDPIGNNSGSLYGRCNPSIYKSTDGQGHSWTLMNSSAPDTYSRYMHVLTVHPNDSNTIFYGGLQMWKSTQSGQPGTFTEVGAAMLHPDHHALVFPDSGNTNKVYEVSDGGFFYSNDGGVMWMSGNADLQITEFQSLSGSSITPGLMGGTQDNGTMAWNGSRFWDTRDDGDSASTIIDVTDPAITVFDVYFDVEPRRSHAGAPCCTFPDITNGLFANEGEPSAVYPPMVQDPTAPNPLYIGTNKLHRGDRAFSFNWTDASPILGGNGYFPDIQRTNVITAVAVAPTNPNRIYISYYDGQIWITNPGGACADISCWHQVNSGLPAAVITRIAVDPTNADIAYVAYSAAPTSTFGPSNFNIGAHVYRTGDGGMSWNPASGSGTGALPPDLPVNTLVVEKHAPTYVWAGTDAGVYKSTDSGASWARFGSGMPNVPVYDLALDEDRGRIFAGTHGRGAFVITQPFLTNFEGWVDNGIWDIPVYGNGFLPLSLGQKCTMQIYQQNGNICATSTQDVMGGDILVDNSGSLVTSNGGFYSGKPVAWACFNGKCIANKNLTDCNQPANPVTSVTVTCGAQVGIDSITNCPEQFNPPSSVLGLPGFGNGPGGGMPAPTTGAAVSRDLFEQPEQRTQRREEAAVPPNPPGGLSGYFNLFATVQVMDGSTRSLCSVAVPYQPTDSDQDVLLRARDSINGSNFCTAATVRASVAGASTGLTEREDPPGTSPKLALQAPGVKGTLLIPSIRVLPGAATGACFSLDGIGLTLRNTVNIMRMQLETGAGGAAGGNLTLLERSGIGTCQVTVTTNAGDSATAIAGRLAGAFQSNAPNPGCAANSNPLDVTQSSDSIVTVMAEQLTMCVHDAGVGFSASPEELPIQTLPLPPRAPMVTVSPPSQTTIYKQIRLLANATDPNGSALTYSWTNEGPFASIIHEDSATPDVQFDAGFRVYTFRVTVTNSAGLTASATTTVTYLGR
jgi:hypothetical protein